MNTYVMHIIILKCILIYLSRLQVNILLKKVAKIFNSEVDINDEHYIQEGLHILEEIFLSKFYGQKILKVNTFTFIGVETIYKLLITLFLPDSFAL